MQHYEKLFQHLLSEQPRILTKLKTKKCITKKDTNSERILKYNTKWNNRFSWQTGSNPCCPPDRASWSSSPASSWRGRPPRARR